MELTVFQTQKALNPLLEGFLRNSLFLEQARYAYFAKPDKGELIEIIDKELPENCSFPFVQQSVAEFRAC